MFSRAAVPPCKMSHDPDALKPLPCLEFYESQLVRLGTRASVVDAVASDNKVDRRGSRHTNIHTIPLVNKDLYLREYECT